MRSSALVLVGLFALSHRGHAEPPNPVETLATGLGAPQGLAVGDQVYVATLLGHDLLAVPLAGGKPVKIASVQRALDVVVRGDYVYWTDLGDYQRDPHDGSLMRRKQRGGAVETLLVKTALPAALCDGGDALYFSTVAGDTGLDIQVLADGAKPHVVTTVPDPAAGNVVATTDALFWYVRGKVFHIGHAGGKPEEIAALEGAFPLAADGADLIAARTDGGILRWRADRVTRVVDRWAVSIAMANGWVAYARPQTRYDKEDGAIELLRVGDAVPVIIAHDIVPLDVAIHDGYLYYTAGVGPGRGGVYRMKLP